MSPDMNATQPSAAQPSQPDVMIVVPTRNMVLYPEMVLPLTVGRPSSVAAVQQAVREQRQIVLLLQRDPENGDPKPAGLYRIGTVANILRYMTSPEGGHHLVVQGVQRFRVTDFIEGQPFLVARGVHIAEPTVTNSELEARFMVLKDQVRQVFDLLPQVPAEFRQTVEAATSPSLLADLAATYLDVTPTEKQEGDTLRPGDSGRYVTGVTLPVDGGAGVIRGG